MTNIPLSDAQARGRAIAASRALLGMDQETLGKRAGMSGATVSNVEQGKDAREPTLKAIRRVLRQRGITLSFDYANGRVVIVATFQDPNEEQDEDEFE